jgi:hypothetical protein
MQNFPHLYPYCYSYTHFSAFQINFNFNFNSFQTSMTNFIIVFNNFLD